MSNYWFLLQKLYIIYWILACVKIVCFDERSLFWSSFCWKSTDSLYLLHFSSWFFVCNLFYSWKFKNFLLIYFFCLNCDLVFSRSFYVECHCFVFCSFWHLHGVDLVSTFQNGRNILLYNFLWNKRECFSIVKTNREIVWIWFFAMTAQAWTCTTIYCFVKNTLTSFTKKFRSDFNVFISRRISWVCAFLVLSSLLLTLSSHGRVAALVWFVNESCFD